MSDLFSTVAFGSTQAERSCIAAVRTRYLLGSSVGLGYALSTGPLR
jgi:hypothetical protein